MPITPSSQLKTAFFFSAPTHAEQYMLCRLPQGFRDSSTIFTNRVHRFIQKYSLFNCFSYIDNFLIGSTESSAAEDLRRVFEALEDVGLKIRLAKSHFFLRGRVTLFGFIVDLQQHSIQPDLKKVEAIHQLPPPRTKKDVKSFLGKIQYFYRLMPGVNSHLDPLFQLSSPNAKFVWTDDCQKAFDKVKNLLSKGPMIFMPGPGPRHLISDVAKGQSIASACFDYDSHHNVFLPLQYSSHALRNSQLNYSQFSAEA